jgi:hypothetical protein
MCVLAGSRKGLSKALQKIDVATKAEEKEGSEPDEGFADGGKEAAEEEVEESDDQNEEKSQLELEDEKLNRTAKSFEKNTFRTPKFWMTWRSTNPSGTSDTHRSAYLIFTGNDCQRFEGTITSSAHDWDNLKIRGRKIHSKASPCPLRWSELS